HAEVSRRGLAGLSEVAFATATSIGATYPQIGELQAVVLHRYTFNASSTFAGTIAIQVADRAGNIVTSNVVLIRDTVPPTITLNAMADALTTVQRLDLCTWFTIWLIDLFQGEANVLHLLANYWSTAIISISCHLQSLSSQKTW